jgi:choline dehydrogenase-like flavoprotein
MLCSFLPIILLLALRALCKTYDYIIVGGGTSGIPLAVRLAQSHSVAIVEAGTYYEISYPFSKTPGADVLPVGSDPDTSCNADWGFVTTPQKGANGRRVHFARGKCLGGSWVALVGHYCLGS